jgi:hypothetical protein
VLRNGRWVPTFPKAKYVFHKGEYAAWEAANAAGDARGNVLHELPADRGGRAGVLVDDDYMLDDLCR